MLRLARKEEQWATTCTLAVPWAKCPPPPLRKEKLCLMLYTVQQFAREFYRFTAKIQDLGGSGPGADMIRQCRSYNRIVLVRTTSTAVRTRRVGKEKKKQKQRRDVEQQKLSNVQKFRASACLSNPFSPFPQGYSSLRPSLSFVPSSEDVLWEKRERERERERERG